MDFSSVIFLLRTAIDIWHCQFSLCHTCFSDWSVMPSLRHLGQYGYFWEGTETNQPSLMGTASKQSPAGCFWASERQISVANSPPTRCKCTRKDILGITCGFVQKLKACFKFHYDLRPGKEDQVHEWPSWAQQGEQNCLSLYDSEAKLD